MSLPRWLARFNGRFLNPGAVARAKWPVLTHVGRRSGTSYRTPIAAHPVDNGYIFVANYGVRSDWVQNILTAGRANLAIGDRTFELERPRLLSNEVANLTLGSDAKGLPPAFLAIDDYLRMDLRTANPA
jgi:deazaflavin-dependent oxidoreductase (nitroreductase family)